MQNQSFAIPIRHGLVLLMALASPAHADIYKHVDAHGNVTFTDKPRPGAVRIVVDPAPGRPAASPGEAVVPRRSSARQPSPAGFPRVDPATQNQRDSMRRQLLEEELGSEQALLAGARTALARAAQAEERRRLAESVRLHEKNIELINKELARIR